MMTQEQADKKYSELATRLGDFYFQRKNAVKTVQVIDANIQKIETEIDGIIKELTESKQKEMAAAKDNVKELKPNDA